MVSSLPAGGGGHGQPRVWLLAWMGDGLANEDSVQSV